MAVPEVDKKLLQELEGMGFSLACATRALHYSGNSTVEDAVNWICDHQDDPDIDQMPLVPVDIDLDAPKPFDLTEEVKKKAENLRNGARRSRIDKEKESEREREKERIRAGKELQEAMRIAEENARKRMIAFRQAEKEEERRARERIRQKLEADKAERRSKLGMPLQSSVSNVQPAVSSDVQPEVSNLQHPVHTSVLVPVKSVKHAEVLSNCLRNLRRNHKDDDARVKRAFQTLLLYVRNVVKDPDNEKYRRIRLTNPVFQERVGNLSGGIRFLELCGFERTNNGQLLYLHREKVDMDTLSSAMSALYKAITNPLFGLLSVELN